MLRFLADYADWMGPLRVFDSITFRALAAAAIAFIAALLFARPFIRRMTERRVTENV